MKVHFMARPVPRLMLEVECDADRRVLDRVMAECDRIAGCGRDPRDGELIHVTLLVSDAKETTMKSLKEFAKAMRAKALELSATVFWQDAAKLSQAAQVLDPRDGDLRDIDVAEDVVILSSEQIGEGNSNDTPNHVFEILLLPTNERGWVAGPHGVFDCAISDWLRHCDGLARSREDAIRRGCDPTEG